MWNVPSPQERFRAEEQNNQDASCEPEELKEGIKTDLPQPVHGAIDTSDEELALDTTLTVANDDHGAKVECACQRNAEHERNKEHGGSKVHHAWHGRIGKLCGERAGSERVTSACVGLL